jgi:hypothetical protein
VLGQSSCIKIIAEECSEMDDIVNVSYSWMLIAFASLEKPKRWNAHFWCAPLVGALPKVVKFWDGRQ